MKIGQVLIPLRIRSISTSEAMPMIEERHLCLNPFENQVYFYMNHSCHKRGEREQVLIPLRIRSISTLGMVPDFGGNQRIVLIPLRIRSISTRACR